MDWDKIKEKYPNGYEVFFTWLEDKSLEDRHLYDFFDKQGISVTVDWSHNYDDLESREIIWFAELSTFDLPAKSFDGTYEYSSNRVEAETKAFVSAFKILEETF